jgi:hypothetical protein
LKGHLKCKGQKNEDKGYFESMGDAKKESYEKKRLHPKHVRSKSPNNPHPPPPPLPPKRRGRRKEKTKKKRKLSCHCKSLLTMVGLIFKHSQSHFFTTTLKVANLSLHAPPSLVCSPPAGGGLI